MERVLILLAVVAVVTLLGQWWKGRDGAVRSALGDTSAGSPSSRWSGLPVEAADVVSAVRPQTPLTFVEFTAPDCVPCTTTAGILDDVTSGHDDVAVVSLDVSDGLALARAHRIMRAPTTLLISNEGHLLGRVSGVPDRCDLERLVDTALDRETVGC